jgi:hypothetical protein
MAMALVWRSSLRPLFMATCVMVRGACRGLGVGNGARSFRRAETKADCEANDSGNAGYDDQSCEPVATGPRSHLDTCPFWYELSDPLLCLWRTWSRPTGCTWAWGDHHAHKGASQDLVRLPSVMSVCGELVAFFALGDSRQRMAALPAVTAPPGRGRLTPWSRPTL